MFCEKCGYQLDNEGLFCPNCGNPVDRTSEIDNDEPKWANPQAVQKVPKAFSNKDKHINLKKREKVKIQRNKKRMLTIIIGVGGIVIAAAVVLVLTLVGVIDWTGPPEYKITENEIEAVEEYDLLSFIEIIDDSDTDWDISVAEDNIEIDKLGSYSVIYSIESGKKQYELYAEFEVVENNLPKVEQAIKEFEFGESINLSKIFVISDLKDGEYDIDDSALDKNKIGIYPVSIHIWNTRDFDKVYEYEITIEDTVMPSLSFDCPREVIQGEQIDLTTMVKASDNYDGDITDKVQIDSDFDSNVPGFYNITFRATDSSGNTKEKSTEIQVCALYKLGDEIQINNWNITLKDFYFSKKASDKNTWSSVLYSVYTAEKGKTFMVVTATVKNTADNHDCFGNKPYNYTHAEVEKTDELEYVIEEISVIADCSGANRTLYPIEDLILGNDLRNYFYCLVDGNDKHNGRFYFYVNDTLEDECDGFILRIESIGDTTDDGKIIYVRLR